MRKIVTLVGVLLVSILLAPSARANESKRAHLEGLIARVDKKLKSIESRLDAKADNAQTLDQWKAKLEKAKARLERRLASLESTSAADSYIQANTNRLPTVQSAGNQDAFSTNPHRQPASADVRSTQGEK